MNKKREGARESGFWRRLWTMPRRRWLLGIPAGGYLMVVAGATVWGGFNAALELTNTEAFCTSCHEMRDNVFAEYRKTIHYSNRTGVRATCPDCHVPRAWTDKVLRKAGATMNELPNWVLGTIDTREKFQAMRLEMAAHEWERLKSNDSLECRNCHELDHMDLARQGRSASRRHDPEQVRERGDTCIDCHQGIAHELPEGWEDLPLWAEDGVPCRAGPARLPCSRHVPARTRHAGAQSHIMQAMQPSPAFTAKRPLLPAARGNLPPVQCR